MKKFGIIVSVIAMSSLAFTACGFDERQAFIDATVRSTCMFFEAEDIFDPALEDEVKAVFADEGLGNTQEELEALKNKYADDVEVQSAILEGISQCSAEFVDNLDIEVPEDSVVDELDELINEVEEGEETDVEADSDVEEETETSEEETVEESEEEPTEESAE